MRVQDLQRYEGGSVPPDSVAKKLERELKIDIMVETDTDNSTPVRKGSGRTVTIADMFDEMMRFIQWIDPGDLESSHTPRPG